MKNIQQLHKDSCLSQSVLCDALEIPRASYYRQAEKEKLITETEPKNKLNEIEKQTVLSLLHSERFMDSSVYQVFYTLPDEKKYYCSIRTMYRILADCGETKERRLVRNHRDAVKPELMAHGPNEVWSWDITKLLGAGRFVYYHLYVILDIYSRYVVGWMIAEKECQHLAKKLIHKTALKQRITPGQLTLHADNGASMKSGTVSELLALLDIEKSHNRPYTSNDNPFSESQFKTLKYSPEFPKRFESFKQAETFCQKFFEWYNHRHYHSGIAYLKPVTVHEQKEKMVLNQRWNTMLAAYECNPGRFNNKKPRKKALGPVYINPPQAVQINCGQLEKNVA